MPMLQHNPELKPILKGLKAGEFTVTNALLSTIYDVLIEYAPPQRSKKFLESVLGGAIIQFCSECGLPKLSHTLTRVFGYDNICTNCLSQFYLQDSGGHHRHRLDYDPHSVASRIEGLAQYNTRAELDVPPQCTDMQRARIQRQGYDDLPYLGIELEVEARSNCPGSTIVRSVLTAIPNFVICKGDGSLHNGMEIVSCPATFDVHKSGVWEPFFQENDGPAKYLRAWRTDTAGCHIHISRAAFLPAQLAKYLIFINSSLNGAFIEKFAGRAGDRWAKRSDKKPGDVFVNTRKYEAVNFSTSAPTLEVRIFRGNISKHGVYRNLEFVQALYLFTKDTSLRELKYTHFCEWLNDKVNRKLFPYLYNWCVHNDYIRGKPVTSIIEDTTKGV